MNIDVKSHAWIWSNIVVLWRRFITQTSWSVSNFMTQISSHDSFLNKCLSRNHDLSQILWLRPHLMTYFSISYSENLCLERNSYLRNFNCSEKSLPWGKFIPQRMYLPWSLIALGKIYISEDVFILRLYCLRRVSYLRECEYSKNFVRLVNSVQ